MKKIIPLLVFLLFAALFLSGCAEAQPHIQSCVTGHVYGFWGGVWHGAIILFSWIGQLFSDNIAIYAVNNNGGWYNFGFFLGNAGFIGFLIRIGLQILKAIFD
jgi:hypothetical protein